MKPFYVKDPGSMEEDLMEYPLKEKIVDSKPKTFPRLIIRIDDLQNINETLSTIKASLICLPHRFKIPLTKKLNYAIHRHMFWEIPISDLQNTRFTITLEKYQNSQREKYAELSLPITVFKECHWCRGSFVMKLLSNSNFHSTRPVITISVHIANAEQDAFCAERYPINRAALKSWKSSLNTPFKSYDRNSCLTDLFFEIVPRNLWPLIHDPRFIELFSNSKIEEEE